MDMTWKLSHIADGNIIQIETAGELTVQQLNQMAKEAIEAGNLHNSTSFLADHRNAVVALNTVEIFERPQAWDKLNFPRASRIAQVAPESRLKDFNFLENVSLNRGYRVRVFTDIDAAKKWLASSAVEP